MFDPRRLFAALALFVTPLVLMGCGRDNVAPTAPSTPAMQDEARILEADASGFDAEAFAAFNDGGEIGANRDAEANGFWFGISRVMLVHASPDAPGVDIRLGWREVARNLEYPDNTRYRFAFSGDRRVRVNVAGTSSTVIDETVPLARWTSYSVFAVNTVAAIEPLVTEDDLSRPAKGNAHVRFIHLSPNAPAVDVAVADGGPVVFGNKRFKDYTPFTPLPAGTYDLEVRLAGTSDVVLPLPGITINDGVIYTVFAKGLVGGTGDQSLGAQIIVNAGDRRSWARPMPARGPAASMR